MQFPVVSLLWDQATSDDALNYRAILNKVSLKA